jgi:hypothetical protein
LPASSSFVALPLNGLVCTLDPRFATGSYVAGNSDERMSQSGRERPATDVIPVRAMEFSATLLPLVRQLCPFHCLGSTKAVKIALGCSATNGSRQSQIQRSRRSGLAGRSFAKIRLH